MESNAAKPLRWARTEKHSPVLQPGDHLRFADIWFGHRSDELASFRVFWLAQYAQSASCASMNYVHPGSPYQCSMSLGLERLHSNCRTIKWRVTCHVWVRVRLICPSAHASVPRLAATNLRPTRG